MDTVFVKACSKLQNVRQKHGGYAKSIFSFKSDGSNRGSKLYLLLSRSRLCHYSVRGAWWLLGFCESFFYPVRVISPATAVESEGVNMTE
jgi:hypothetical protein